MLLFDLLNRYSASTERWPRRDPVMSNDEVKRQCFDQHWTYEVAVFTTRKRSLGQGNVFTPVCHSVHGREVLVGLPACITGRMTSMGGSAYRGVCIGGGAYRGVGQTPLELELEKRAVRILLECFLVEVEHQVYTSVDTICECFYQSGVFKYWQFVLTSQLLWLRNYLVRFVAYQNPFSSFNLSHFNDIFSSMIPAGCT